MPKDTPGNQLQNIYKQEAMKPQLDWARLPKLLDRTSNWSDPQLDISVVAVFQQRYAIRIAQSYIWEAWCKAMVQLQEVANMGQGSACLAD